MAEKHEEGMKNPEDFKRKIPEAVLQSQSEFVKKTEELTEAQKSALDFYARQRPRLWIAISQFSL